MVTNAKVNQKETNRNKSTQKQERKKNAEPKRTTVTYTSIYRAGSAAVVAKIPNKLPLFARPMEVQ